jgi:ABC-type branched-subunit amino acid transport system substrate-binding protein
MPSGAIPRVAKEGYKLRMRIVAAVVALFAVVGLSATASAAPAHANKLLAGPGVDTKHKTIHVSALLPLTGPQDGHQILYGLDAYFKYVNAHGGVGGYKIRYDAQDTQFNPTVAIQQYQKDKDSTAMFAILLGTPSVTAVQPQLKADGVLVAPISNDARWIRDPNMAPVEGTFQSATAGLIEYAIKNRGGLNQTFCEMKENDPLGAGFAGGAAFAVGYLHFKVAKTVTFNITDPTMTGQVSDLKSAGCDVVIYEGATGASILAATAAEQLNFNALWLMPQISYLAQYATSPQSSYLASHWLLWDYGVAWNDTKAPGQKLMVAMLKKYEHNPDPNIIIQWGWQNGIATVDVLKQAMKNHDLSRAGLLKAAAQLKTVTFAGMFPPLFYGGDVAKRRPSPAINIVKVNPKVPTGLQSVRKFYSSNAAQGYIVQTFP